MNSPIISIIIPAYNLQDYIGRCLDSVLAQSFKDFEAIIINDGSDDATGEICDSYRRKDHRIKLINQKNRGLGCARNRGLDNAKGELIAFVDGDDVLHPQYLEILYSLATESDADIVVCNYIKGCDENLLRMKNYNIQKSDIKVIDKQSLLNKMYNEHPFITVWAKIYRRNMIKSGMVARGIGEDVEFNSRMYFIADKVVYVDYPLYLWVTRNRSLSNSSFNGTDLNKIKNYFYAWVNLRKNKLYSNYAIKKLFKTFLSVRYDAPQNFTDLVKHSINYYKKLSLRYLYRDTPLIQAFFYHFLVHSPASYKVMRKVIASLTSLHKR